MTDLAYLVLKEENLNLPESYLEVFDILFKAKIISKELSENLKNARRMRNFLAHEYYEIDDSIVFQAINKKLEEDINKFLKAVSLVLK